MLVERRANVSLIAIFLSSCFRCEIFDNFACCCCFFAVRLVSILSVEFSYESPVVVLSVFWPNVLGGRESYGCDFSFFLP